MTPLRIWAPSASTVDVVTEGRSIAAAAEPGGWWATVAIAPGQDYQVAIDGGAARPDPRSRWQPHGVHGPSRWLEPSTAHVVPSDFRAVPLHDAVIYELHVGTFSTEGTFDAAVPHLDHLVELGVTHVELMPVAQFAGHHGWGYDGVGLYAAHEPYGGPAGLRTLIEQCHRRGLAVLIDVVHNHLGPDGAYAPEFGPYKTSRHHTPWGEAINLDGEHAREVRRFLIDSALMWLHDYGADGLRLDAVHALRDDSPRHFVAELADEVRELQAKLGRPLVLIGEYDEHDPRCVAAPQRGGWGLDAHWNDDFHHVVHSLLTGESSGYYVDFAAPDALAKVLEHGYVLDGKYSAFRDRPHGKPFGELPRDRLVAYVQSHDQVGNRAAGERLHQLCGIPRAKIAAALLLTSPFVPMLFQGEEWAASSPFCYFVDFESAELSAAVREGRRAEHAAAGWSTPAVDPTDPATRVVSTLPWAERAHAPHADMLDWYRRLIAVRKAYPELRNAAAGSIHVAVDGQVVRIERGSHTLLINLSDRSVPCAGRVALASAPVLAGQLPPTACALVRR